MVNLVLIITMILDYLAETTFMGEPGVWLILFFWIVFTKAALTTFYQFFGTALLKLWITLKNPQSSKFMSGDLFA